MCANNVFVETYQRFKSDQFEMFTSMEPGQVLMGEMRWENTNNFSRWGGDTNKFSCVQQLKIQSSETFLSTTQVLLSVYRTAGPTIPRISQNTCLRMTQCLQSEWKVFLV